MDRLLRGAEVQQRAGSEMHQCTPPPLPHHQDHSGMMQHFRLISNIVFLHSDDVQEDTDGRKLSNHQF